MQSVDGTWLFTLAVFWNYLVLIVWRLLFFSTRKKSTDSYFYIGNAKGSSWVMKSLYNSLENPGFECRKVFGLLGPWRLDVSLRKGYFWRSRRQGRTKGNHVYLLMNKSCCAQSLGRRHFLKLPPRNFIFEWKRAKGDAQDISKSAWRISRREE